MITPTNQSGSYPANPEQTPQAVYPNDHHQIETNGLDSPSPKKSRKPLYLWLTLLMAGLIVIAVFARFKSEHKTKVLLKKDIPLISYATTAGGDFPHYPIKYSVSEVALFTELQLDEGLVGYTNETQIAPALATSWSNPNDKTWVFNLRHGVKFHTGRTMTAKDVKYTFDYALAHSNDTDNSLSYAANGIDKVNIDNDYQVTITTSSPNPTLLNNIAFVGIIDSKAPLGDYLAGSGPYIIKPGTSPTNKTIDLVATNDYWQGHVYTREIKMTLYDDFTKLAADINAGKIDYGGEIKNQNLSKVKGYQPVSIPDLGTTYVGMNTENTFSPLHNLAARQAVAYALNVPAILKAGGIQGKIVNQLIPPILAGYNPQIADQTYDPDKARQLLASVPGHNHEVTFAYPTEDAQSLEIIKELSSVGFNIKPVIFDDFNKFAQETNAGHYDFFSLANSTSSDGLPILGTVTGVGYYNNPKVNQLVDDANSSFNDKQRINDMQQVEQIIDAEKPVVALFEHTRIYLHKQNYVSNVDIPALETSNYFWKTYQK
jgi:peptide/nickel transport system substrate-binding protein